jgi:DDE superfamily endonuclease
LASVDGTHCRICEPRATPSKEWYSHKFHKPGVVYEIGLAIFESKVVWTNGPFPAGQSDLAVFRKVGGLKSIMPDGMKLIADNGYQGEPIISTPNEFDTPVVKSFKERARARHETFNKRIKEFKILDERFRHGVDKHKIIFEAICVITQYDMENGRPLFDV